MRIPPVFLAALVLLGSCTSEKSKLNGNTQAPARPSFDVPKLLVSYQQNNQHTVPVVAYMIDADPVVLIYQDGTVITRAEHGGKYGSGLLVARLPADELARVLANIASTDGFWNLNNEYRLSRWSEQPSQHVSIRIAARPEKTVSVYGNLERAEPGDTDVPPEFREFITSLLKIRPQNSALWNPGYVEIGFADYSYAPEGSLHWPSNWPSLTSPLVRDVKGWVIQKVMIFPSQELAELDSFLKRRPERGAILINNWKASASYRWPLPGEKYWTSWDQ